MTKYTHPADPRGLIYEAYQMDLSPQDCRTIFFDWALGHRETANPAQIASLLATYEPKHPDHPMTTVLKEGLKRTASPRRRGGRSGRSRGEED